MERIVITTLRRSLISALLSAALGCFFGFIVAGLAFLSRYTEDFAFWFRYASLDITVIFFLWWVWDEYLAFKKGIPIAKKLNVPIGDVMWLSLQLNQFAIMKEWTREKFLRALKEEKHHRPHHPDCDAITEPPRRR